jgi:hypothetical protein
LQKKKRAIRERLELAKLAKLEAAKPEPAPHDLSNPAVVAAIAAATEKATAALKAEHSAEIEALKSAAANLKDEKKVAAVMSGEAPLRGTADTARERAKAAKSHTKKASAPVQSADPANPIDDVMREIRAKSNDGQEHTRFNIRQMVGREETAVIEAINRLKERGLLEERKNIFGSTLYRIVGDRDSLLERAGLKASPTEPKAKPEPEAAVKAEPPTIEPDVGQTSTMKLKDIALCFDFYEEFDPDWLGIEITYMDPESGQLFTDGPIYVGHPDAWPFLELLEKKLVEAQGQAERARLGAEGGNKGSGRGGKGRRRE